MSEAANVVAGNALANRLSEIADVVLIRYRLEPDARIDFVSPSSLPILGYGPDEFRARPELGLEIVHPEDRERLEHECSRDPEATFVGRAVHKDGRVRWIERRQRRVVDEHGRLIGLEATLRDITAQHEAEEALRESEQRWQAVFETAQDVFLLVDDERTVIAANPAAGHLLGVCVEEILGCKIDEFTSEDTTRRWSLLLREGSLRSEALWRRLDGTPRRVRVSATANVAPGRHLAIVHDITEQRVIEEALHESQLRFRTAFEHAPIGMALVATDGCWLEVNRSFCEFLGYSEDELCRTTWQALTHPEDLDADLASVRATLEGRIDGYTMEKRYLRKDGGIVLGRLNVALVRTPEGEPRYFISQLVDITPRQASANTAGFEPFLTQRQLEILQFLADGKSTAQIAEELYLSKTTVRNHIARLLSNLGVHSRVQAVVAGTRLGLIDVAEPEAPSDA